MNDKVCATIVPILISNKHTHSKAPNLLQCDKSYPVQRHIGKNIAKSDIDIYVAMTDSLSFRAARIAKVVPLKKKG